MLITEVNLSIHITTFWTAKVSSCSIGLGFMKKGYYVSWTHEHVVFLRWLHNLMSQSG
jgi:hypothetical protein